MFSDKANELTSDCEILQHCATFYENLYNREYVPGKLYSNFSDIPMDKRLSEEDRAVLDRDVEISELELALRAMKKEAAPGYDGLTVPFYLTFWNSIGKYVYDNVLYAQAQGTFTLDQRRGILKLLPKRNKNPAFVTNLRPITLLGVDYKLLTKALATRLKDIIPSLLHVDQKGFVKSRFLGESLIEIQTIMTMADEFEPGKEFALFSLDIYKALTLSTGHSCTVIWLSTMYSGGTWFRTQPLMPKWLSGLIFKHCINVLTFVLHVG